MEQGPRRSRSGWKILGIVVGIILLSLLGLLFYVRALAHRRYAQTQQRVKEEIARIRAREGGRPVLHGEAHSGNAWDEYQPGLVQVGQLKDARELVILATSTASRNPSFGDAALVSCAAALDHLAQGARASRACSGWHGDGPAGISDFMAFEELASLGVLKARKLLEAQDGAAAVRMWLDILAYGRDRTSEGPIINALAGLTAMSLALRESGEAVRLSTLDPGALLLLDRGLAELDGNFPRADRTLSDEAVQTVDRLLQNGEDTFWSQLLLADAADRWLDACQRAGEAAERDWKEEQAVAFKQALEIKRSWNPLARAAVPGNVGRSFRDTRALLRLLRVAVRFQAAGEVLHLADPFGTTLKTSLGEGKLKVWSVGRDGRDDGGTGNWTTQGPDIVLEVKR